MPVSGALPDSSGGCLVYPLSGDPVRSQLDRHGLRETPM